MNATQNKELHILLGQVGMMPQKAILVFGASGGRTEHSSELTESEARDLCSYLHSLPNLNMEASNKMRRKIISIAYEMQWAKAGDWREAVKAIDAFLSGPKSLFKKKLNRHSYKELVQVVSQFEMMYKKYLQKF